MFRSPVLTALKFLSYVESNGGHGTVPEATQRIACSSTKIEKVTCELRRAGLLESQAGHGGGYFLTLRGRNATLGEIAEIFGTERAPFAPDFLALPVLEVVRRF